jgi:hypothetical protein
LYPLEDIEIQLELGNALFEGKNGVSSTPPRKAVDVFGHKSILALELILTPMPCPCMGYVRAKTSWHGCMNQKHLYTQPLLLYHEISQTFHQFNSK